MATERPPVKVSPRTLRMWPDQHWWWDPPRTFWRRGPNTPDGFWMVNYLCGVAVRIIWDEDAPELTAQQFDERMDRAVSAEKDEVQDAYLEALTLSSSLERIREAVRSGSTGGQKDGGE